MVLSATMNTRSLLPWEINEVLLPDRLQAVAVAAKNQRNMVIDLSVEGRDNPWCLGCRAYSWTCSILAEMAMRDDCQWLRTRSGGLAFTFYVDGVAFKFYRGKAEEPKSNSLRSGVREMLSVNRLDFMEDEIRQEAEGWFWLLAIDTDVDGRVLEVVVFQANERGEIRHPWSIPLDGRVVAVSSISDVRREGVEQAPAQIGVPGDKVRAANNTDKDDEN